MINVFRLSSGSLFDEEPLNGASLGPLRDDLRPTRSKEATLEGPNGDDGMIPKKEEGDSNEGVSRKRSLESKQSFGKRICNFGMIGGYE